MDWKIIWTLLSIFVLPFEPCIITNPYLKKAFSCKSSIFYKKQWRFSLYEGVVLMCKRNEHIWVFNAHATRQGIALPDRICVTPLLMKKCKAQNRCDLSKAHFLDRVSKNWTKKSVVLDIVFACVDKTVSNLMLLKVFHDLPDPCLDEYTFEDFLHSRDTPVPILPKPKRQKANTKKNLTLKFVEILWMQSHLSRNREKVVLYVVISIAVGIIFILMAILFYKNAIKAPTATRVSLAEASKLQSAKKNVTKNNNNSLSSHLSANHKP